MSAENVLILNVYGEMLSKNGCYQEPTSSYTVHQRANLLMLMTLSTSYNPDMEQLSDYCHCCVSLCRSNSTVNGWLHAVWHLRERPWLTALSPVRSRVFSLFWPCRGPRQEIRQPRATRASTHTALSLRATRRSTSPNR